MILRPALIARIRAGQPAALLRPAVDDDEEPFRADRRYSIEAWRPATYEDPPAARELGQVREVLGHFIVLDQVRGQLADIDDRAAKQLGFNSRHLFLEAWRELHGADAGEVWRARIELDRAHRPRFLARPIPGKQGDYTANPGRAIDDVEVVEDAYLEDFAKRAADAHRITDIAKLELELAEARTLEERVGKTLALAKERGVDVRNDRRIIERRIASIEGKLRRQRAA
jgi:hypothetical protein